MTTSCTTETDPTRRERGVASALAELDAIEGVELDADLLADLEGFEANAREELGLTAEAKPREQWRDPLPDSFTAAQRPHTTLLVSGLTMAHDLFVQAGLSGVGYKVEALECPDDLALRFGKEYGNRGQCNPTYFTVGNLIKHLCRLRDERGMPTEQIVERYLFVTAGACGPCRFGTYVTEYRKALRDAGFDGFRVLLFQQKGGLKQATGEEVGLKLDPPFFLAVLKALMIGDVLNAIGYRMRPYEIDEGATDAALERCKGWIAAALGERRWILPALLRCRLALAKVRVDRTRVKPRVAIIGEFWAMTTEGDGNYRLQRFLEQEGAEVEIQLVCAWLLYTIWEVRWDSARRADLHGVDGGRFGLRDVDVRKRRLMLWAAELVLRATFQSFANILGLHGYHLPDMNELARLSHQHYDNALRGGEGHMEVGKLIQNVLHKKVNMTVSVKPFGCMPSSSVSDGVQSLITERYPEAIFLPIETSGDGAVNVYSRIQMQLFKARQAARREVDAQLEAHGLDLDTVKRIVAESVRWRRSLHRSPHAAGCTAADVVAEVGANKRFRFGLPAWRHIAWRLLAG